MEVYLLWVMHINNETEDSKSYYLQPINGAPEYKAGQFLTILVDLEGVERRRSYSLSSTPGIDEALCITIKRIQNGMISRYLFDHLREGSLLKTLPPAGKFTLPEDAHISQTRHYFFVAAGSGITPVFSLVKEILYKHHFSQVTLVCQNTSENKSIYRKQLLEIKRSFRQRFRLVEIFSQPLDHNFTPQRLNNTLFELLVEKYVTSKEVSFYLCGPSTFMRMAQFTLRVLGYRDDQIRKETFVVDYVPPPPLITDTSVKELTIHLSNKTYLLQVAYPQNILEAALKQGVSLPYSCRGGRCSSCTARCNQGRVKMSVNDVLTEQDLASGLVLTCVGYAETDVELTFE